MTLPADNHVHTQCSWDAVEGSMRRSCERAVEFGLPAIAFTDHADFTRWTTPDTAAEDPSARTIGAHAHSGWLDVDDYRRHLDRCRWEFPDLRILSGVETGEPHLFKDEVAGLLATTRFDRVLGSLHALESGGDVVYLRTLFRTGDPEALLRDYLAETVRMIETAGGFQVLAHVDYPIRFWPARAGAFEAARFEEEYREVLRALARSGRVLEVNTGGPQLVAEIVRWWYLEGGTAVSFGSDAHVPWLVGNNFDLAAAMVESCGFRPGRDPLDFWRR
ncbi:PHP domain-containing protein [Saccharothrix australiensis]|uniref:Histidinol-phosphatase n=1 Tax=Saccharothrix australiensis TaxID=2072 RepID=A0A495W1U8_9PSEU|nr:PHP domain-containing protein [Saccharothrix australiensis]RKT53838.1 histidinol-phosphatase (PHP family) [Saccharothrix australiensis]